MERVETTLRKTITACTTILAELDRIDSANLDEAIARLGAKYRDMREQSEGCSE